MFNLVCAELGKVNALGLLFSSFKQKNLIKMQLLILFKSQILIVKQTTVKASHKLTIQPNQQN